MSVLHEHLTENDCEKPTNLISAVQYVQSLEKLQICLNRHMEAAREAWQLDEHFRIPENVINELEEKGMNVRRWQAILHLRTKDPPKLNQTLPANPPK
jgi:hypothetical protein